MICASVIRINAQRQLGFRFHNLYPGEKKQQHDSDYRTDIHWYSKIDIAILRSHSRTLLMSNNDIIINNSRLQDKVAE
ncbi:hypothetical protein E2C01_032618 [Portunus trituberculatus]|uniref:Uncharacterized protein n=1 Tax=Portunus trituberculatus TaxID=210409 RepID=A0A5B7F1F9_PORTR|nr:hypothetical protein [Portunus trituberculatus]